MHLSMCTHTSLSPVFLCNEGKHLSPWRHTDFHISFLHTHFHPYLFYRVLAKRFKTPDLKQQGLRNTTWPAATPMSLHSVRPVIYLARQKRMRCVCMSAVINHRRLRVNPNTHKRCWCLEREKQHAVGRNKTSLRTTQVNKLNAASFVMLLCSVWIGNGWGGIFIGLGGKKILYNFFCCLLWLFVQETRSYFVRGCTMILQMKPWPGYLCLGPIRGPETWVGVCCRFR